MFSKNNAGLQLETGAPPVRESDSWASGALARGADVERGNVAQRIRSTRSRGSKAATRVLSLSPSWARAVSVAARTADPP